VKRKKKESPETTDVTGGGRKTARPKFGGSLGLKILKGKGGSNVLMGEEIKPPSTRAYYRLENEKGGKASVCMERGCG